MSRKLKVTPPTLAESRWVIALGAAAFLLLSGMVYMISHFLAAKSARADLAQMPVYFKRLENALPFPSTLDPAQFQTKRIRDAYFAAKEIPGVLAQQPCYCYCQRMGHRSLLDCFHSTHAASCNLCVKEALLAAQMHREGKSAEEIRAAIIHSDWANGVFSTKAANTSSGAENSRELEK